MKDEVERVVVRVWNRTETPILIFPDDKQPGGLVQMWEPCGEHGAGSASGVVKQTRPATFQEAQQVVKEYEKHYRCKLKIVKRC